MAKRPEVYMMQRPALDVLHTLALLAPVVMCDSGGLPIRVNGALLQTRNREVLERWYEGFRENCFGLLIEALGSHVVMIDDAYKVDASTSHNELLPA